MSDKKRRDITLGEMQAKCVAYDCANCDPSLANLCRSMQTEEGEMKAPRFWDLTDPPRFTEAQMAFWRGWYEIGCNNVLVGYNGNFILDMKGNGAIVIEHYAAVKLGINLKVGETLDLADLLGKDGAEC